MFCSSGALSKADSSRVLYLRFRGRYSPYRNSVNIVFLFLNVFNDKILDQHFAITYNKTPPNMQLHFWMIYDRKISCCCCISNRHFIAAYGLFVHFFSSENLLWNKITSSFSIQENPYFPSVYFIWVTHGLYSSMNTMFTFVYDKEKRSPAG